MKHTSLLIFLIVSFITCDAQLSKLANRLKTKAENKVAQRLDTKTGKAVDEALDDLEGGKKSGQAAKAESEAVSNEPATQATVKALSKFDFVAGETIVYTEDFMQDAIGELPLHWNTSGKGEVVTLEGFNGHWLKMYQNATYLTANKKEFTKNFTVEFDAVLQFNYKSYSLPLVTVGFLASNTLETTDNELLKTPSKFSSAQLQLRPHPDANSLVSFNSNLAQKNFFKSTDQKLASLSSNYNKIAHVAMQVQDQRLRIWINSEKIFDLPKAVSIDHPFNQLFFKIHNSGYKEDQIVFYISNLKVAYGVPDTRHKLIEEGKFSTNGILFAVNSATIEKQSYGIIKEIAGVLKQFPQVRIQVTGHTSSDGDDKQNIELSKKRAEAVKTSLVNDYGIDASKIETDGKGETEPVADNNTQEGKLLNRRVVFTKL